MAYRIQYTVYCPQTKSTTKKTGAQTHGRDQFLHQGPPQCRHRARETHTQKKQIKGKQNLESKHTGGIHFDTKARHSAGTEQGKR
jgi:hypothetical protein